MTFSFFINWLIELSMDKISLGKTSLIKIILLKIFTEFLNFRQAVSQTRIGDTRIKVD